MLLITFSTTTLVTSWVIYSHLLLFNVYRLFSSAYILNQKIIREFIRGAGGGRTLFITWALTWCARTTATTMAATIIDDFLKLTRILLMCALRAHNSKPILEKVYWELKKLSILNKTFSKIDLLVCALRAHINRTQILIPCKIVQFVLHCSCSKLSMIKKKWQIYVKVTNIPSQSDTLK